MNQYLKIGLVLIILAIIVYGAAYSFYSELVWALLLAGTMFIGYGAWKTTLKVKAGMK